MSREEGLWDGNWSQNAGGGAGRQRPSGLRRRDLAVSRQLSALDRNRGDTNQNLCCLG